MIAIINRGATSPQERENPDGERYYDVRINDRIITQFQHRRGDGLAECLRKAAQAVEDKFSETT